VTGGTPTDTRDAGRPGAVRIAPSVLSADFGMLAEQVGEVARAADWLHVDVMDGHFVPNITIGLPVVEAIRKRTRLPLDLHLMISNPDPFLERFVKAGGDWLTVHVEACPHLHRTLARIRELGARAGVALNPATPPGVLDYAVDSADLVLVMSVNPGFGGQSFMSSQLAKVERLRAMIDASGRDIVLEVDGGVTPQTARLCLAAGADALVAGTAVFRGGPDAYAANIRALREA